MNNKNLNVKRAWFVEAIHDLYSGSLLLGPYDSKEEAEKEGSKERLSKRSHIVHDQVDILECEYVEFGGDFYPLLHPSDK